jgi:hypothetical protein
MSFPLDVAKICINCDFLFAGGNKVCVKCGSENWVWLGRYIKALKGATVRVEVNDEYIKNNDIACDRSGSL